MMNKNLETADILVKVVLSVSTIILFIAGIISGPFALMLVVLSSLILLIFLMRRLYKSSFFRHRNKSNKII